LDIYQNFDPIEKLSVCPCCLDQWGIGVGVDKEIDTNSQVETHFLVDAVLTPTLGLDLSFDVDLLLTLGSMMVAFSVSIVAIFVDTDSWIAMDC
jgi:hypothetical protein